MRGRLVVLVPTRRDRGVAVAVVGVLHRLVDVQRNHADRADTTGFGDDDAFGGRCNGVGGREGSVVGHGPGGQSTQMIVGADATNDAAILSFSQRLYAHYGLRRVYYSAFSPVPGAASCLPHDPPPLRREHRLYQADWLMRFYGFSADEILDAVQDGMLDEKIDPKLAWALKHREFFPVDLQSAPREVLLRVPGLGVRIVDRLIAARRVRTLCLADLMRQKTAVTKMLPFICLSDHHPGKSLEHDNLLHRWRVGLPARQLELF